MQTRSSTDYESEIQVSALDLNLFTKHRRISNNQNGKQNKKKSSCSKDKVKADGTLQSYITGIS